MRALTAAKPLLSPPPDYFSVERCACVLRCRRKRCRRRLGSSFCSTRRRQRSEPPSRCLRQWGPVARLVVACMHHSLLSCSNRALSWRALHFSHIAGTPLVFVGPQDLKVRVRFLAGGSESQLSKFGSSSTLRSPSVRPERCGPPPRSRGVLGASPAPFRWFSTASATAAAS